MKILIGADPEVFVKNPNSNAFVNAHGLVPGDKATPFSVRDGAVQVDGMALEFNINPAETADQFVSNIKSVYEQLKGMVPGYNVVPEPVAVFDKVYFDNQPAESKELGCNPDYNAWTGRVNNPPNGNQPMRTASGHIHIGWTQDEAVDDPVHFADCCAVVKQLDYYLGIHSLLWDKDNRRRQMYGKAGAFRPKPYGVEYRVLSNAWLRDERLMRWVYERTKQGVEDLLAGKAAVDSCGSVAKYTIDNNWSGWENDNYYDEKVVGRLPMELRAA